MAREDFLAFQWGELQKQIRYTYEKSGLCQRQFKAAKITPDDIKTREDFTNKVPYTTKHDLLADQEEDPPYGTRLAVPENEIFIIWLTSGTSGKGQEVHTLTREDWNFFLEAPAMIYTWAGWHKGDKAMNPLPLGMTAASPFHYLGLERVGCSVLNLGTYDTKTKLEYMKRFKVNGIFATPAYLETLTTEIEGMGLDPARDLSVERILIAIQAYPISFIHKMEEKWNVRTIYDYYGSSQRGAGCTCEKGAVIGDQRGHYHLYEHFSHVEVLNPETGQPVGPGEFGEVVVTPLNKKASPYLRFKSADKVRYFPHDACDCGRPFSLLEAGTITRYDDMMKIKGVNVWPESIDEIVLTKEEVSEYQGTLYISDDKKERAEVSMEFKDGVAPEVKQRLMVKISDELRDATGIGFKIKEASEALPHAVFKVRRWTDDRVKGLERTT